MKELKSWVEYFVYYMVDGEGLGEILSEGTEGLSGILSVLDDG